jgi:hypothetical protein
LQPIDQFTVQYDIEHIRTAAPKGVELGKDAAGLTGEREYQQPEGLDRRIGPASVGNQRAPGPRLKTNLS